MRGHATIVCLALALLLAGCGGDGSADQGGSPAAAAKPPHTVTHELGVATVPADPRRVVVLDNVAADTVAAIGIRPIGVPDQGTLPGYLSERFAGIESIGPNAEPSLEKVAELRPDVIVGAVLEERLHERLSRIAPTVSATFEFTKTSWKTTHTQVARALGRPDRGLALLERFKQRSAALRNRVEDATALQISNVRACGADLYIHGPNIFSGEVIGAVGFSLPASQRKVDGLQEVSKEQFRRLDGDVIFLWSCGAARDSRTKGRQAIAELRADPVFRRLGAVRAGNVNVVGDHWIGVGPLAADKMLDDLAQGVVSP